VVRPVTLDFRASVRVDVQMSLFERGAEVSTPTRLDLGRTGRKVQKDEPEGRKTRIGFCLEAMRKEDVKEEEGKWNVKKTNVASRIGPHKHEDEEWEGGEY